MIIRGMSLPLIFACVTIVLALIIFPLIVSYKAEKKSEGINGDKPEISKTEWDKIKEYGKKINKQTRSKK